MVRVLYQKAGHIVAIMCTFVIVGILLPYGKTTNDWYVSEAIVTDGYRKLAFKVGVGIFKNRSIDKSNGSVKDAQRFSGKSYEKGFPNQ